MPRRAPGRDTRDCAASRARGWSWRRSSPAAARECRCRPARPRPAPRARSPGWCRRPAPPAASAAGQLPEEVRAPAGEREQDAVVQLARVGERGLGQGQRRVLGQVQAQPAVVAGQLAAARPEHLARSSSARRAWRASSRAHGSAGSCSPTRMPVSPPPRVGRSRSPGRRSRAGRAVGSRAGARTPRADLLPVRAGSARAPPAAPAPPRSAGRRAIGSAAGAAPRRRPTRTRSRPGGTRPRPRDDRMPAGEAHPSRPRPRAPVAWRPPRPGRACECGCSGSRGRRPDRSPGRGRPSARRSAAARRGRRADGWRPRSPPSAARRRSWRAARGWRGRTPPSPS